MREDFKQRLYSAATLRIISRVIILEPNVLNQVRYFIDEGVNKMSTEDYESQIRRQLAQDNLLNMIDFFIENVQNRNQDPIYAFRNATMSLCPLWPFC